MRFRTKDVITDSIIISEYAFGDAQFKMNELFRKGYVIAGKPEFIKTAGQVIFFAMLVKREAYLVPVTEEIPQQANASDAFSDMESDEIPF